MKSYIEITWSSEMDNYKGEPIGLPYLVVQIQLGLLDEKGDPLRDANGQLKSAIGEYVLYLSDLEKGYSVWDFISEAVSHHDKIIPKFIKLELKGKSDQLQ